MKVAQVSLRYIPAIGGVEMHVNNLSLELNKMGVKVVIYTSRFIDSIREIKDIPNEEKINGSIIKRYKWFTPIIGRDTTYIQPKIFIDIKNQDFDLVHVHGLRYFPCYGGILFTYLSKIPVIATLHHNPSFYKTWFQKIHDAIFLKRLERFSKIIALTDFEKKYLENIGIKKDKIVVIPNGIPDGFFHRVRELERKRDEFRNVFGLHNKYLILYIGRLTRERNFEVVLRAIRLLPNNVRNNLLFVIAGPDFGYKKKLSELIASLNLKENVRILGPVGEVSKSQLLVMADLFVMPSITEAFSIASLEAMAANLPILASNVGGLPSIIEHDKTGYLLNPYNPSEWAHYIRYLLENKRKGQALGAAARKKAEHYRWSILARKIINIYNEVLDSQS